jgi:RNA polymerase sigma-70 factor, ECF subfamily
MPSPVPGSKPGGQPDAGPPDFDDLYAEFHARIRRYLSRLVSAREAEDLTQEVFARVSKALPRFRGDSKVSTWVYRIATNIAFDRLRSPAFARGGQVLLEGERPTTERSAGIELVLVRKEMNDCIRQYIDGLPPSYRSVVILSEQEELTNQEIADALGITLDTVKIRLHRARARLRSQLGTGCAFYRDERNELACEPRGKGVSPPD